MSKLQMFTPKAYSKKEIQKENIENIIFNYYKHTISKKNKDDKFSTEIICYILNKINQTGSDLFSIAEDIFFTRDEKFEYEKYQNIVDTINDTLMVDNSTDYAIDKFVIENYPEEFMNFSYNFLNYIKNYEEHEVPEIELLQLLINFHQKVDMNTKSNELTVKNIIYETILHREYSKKDLEEITKIKKDAEIEHKYFQKTIDELNYQKDTVGNISCKPVLEMMINSLNPSKFDSSPKINIEKIINQNIQHLNNTTHGKETIFSYLSSDEFTYENLNQPYFNFDELYENFGEEFTAFQDQNIYYGNQNTLTYKIIFTNFQIFFDKKYLTSRLYDVIQKYQDEVIPLNINNKIYLTFMFCPHSTIEPDSVPIYKKAFEKIEKIIEISKAVEKEINLLKKGKHTNE